MHYLVDPTKPHNHDTIRLFTYLDSQQRVSWIVDEDYRFGMDLLRFTYPLVRRQRRPGKTDCWEVISHDIVGSGSTGVVYDIKGKLVEQNGVLTFKQHKKNWIIKIQRHDDAFPMSKAEMEQDLLQRASNMGVKNMTRSQSTSYIFMEKVPGVELHTIIDEDTKGTRPLSLQDRWQLCLGILHAVNDQVTRRNIVHRDLNSANFIVDMSVRPFKITVIDFGLGAKAESPETEYVGTFGFIAPEVYYEDGIHSDKMDVFSCARILGLLFHADHNSYIAKEEYSAIEDVPITPSTFDHLFQGIGGLSLQNKIDIQTILANMLTSEPEDRLSLAEAIACFENIRIGQEYQHHRQQQKNDASLLWEKLSLQTELLQEKSVQLERRGHINAAIIMFDLALDLQDKQIAIQKNLTNMNTTDVVVEIGECKKLLRQARPVLNEHRDCRYIWANIGLALAGLGIIYLAIAAATQKSRGNFLFFAQTRSSVMTDEVETTLSQLASCA